MDINWNMNIRGTICATIIGKFRIAIHKNDYDKKTWFLTCIGIEIDTVPLETNDIEKAKSKALYLIKKKLEVYQEFIDKISIYV